MLFRSETGDFLTVVTRDTQRVVSFITGDLNSIMVSVSSFIGISYVLSRLNLHLYLAIISFAPLYGIVFLVFSGIRYKLSLAVREKNAKLADSMAASARHQRTIYLHRGQTIIAESLRYIIGECNDAEYKSLINNSWSGLSLSFISFLMSAIAFLWGSVLVLKGAVTLGMLLTFTSYSGKLLSPVTSLTSSALSWQETRVALSRIARYYELKDHPLSCNLRQQNINYVRFEGARLHKSDLDLTLEMRIAPVTSIVGYTGVGKSAICECLAGYATPASGIVTFSTNDGEDVCPQIGRAHV